MTDLSQTLKEQFAFLQPRPSRDCPAFDCPTEKVLEVLAALKAQHGFDLLCDVTAIDQFDAVPCFLVVYHLYATQGHRYLRVVTPCQGDSENPTCPSVTALWAGADWHEREAYDMFGILFEGHGDLRRILMWDGYPYHPLRKEFPLAGIEVPFPAADVAERTGLTVTPAPMMGGPFHASQHGTMAKREPRADDESWNEHKPKDARQAVSETPRDLRNA